MTIETAWRAERGRRDDPPDDAAAIRALPPRLLRGLVRRRRRPDGPGAPSRPRQARARPGRDPIRPPRRDDEGRDGRGDARRASGASGTSPTGRSGSTSPSVSGDIASVVVHSAVYVEYALLARTSDGWRITEHALALGGWPWSARLSRPGERSPPTEPTRRASSRGRATRTRPASSSATASGSSTRSTATGEPTVLLMPTWSIIHSRLWKLQIPYLARHYRVITFDGRGNGRSDRPTDPEAYREEEFAADALAVMDATATERAVLVCAVEGRGTVAAPRGGAPRAGRGDGLHRSGRAARPRPMPRSRARTGRSGSRATTDDGWGKYNRHYWVEHYADFLEFFFVAVPHRAALDEAARGHRRLGARDGRPDPRRHPAGAPAPRTRRDVRALLSRIDCPILVIHGSDDHVRPCASGARLAELANGALAVLEGSATSPMPATRSRSTCCSATSSESIGRTEA